MLNAYRFRTLYMGPYIDSNENYTQNTGIVNMDFCILLFFLHYKSLGNETKAFS